jgi:hypothetical protein
VFYLFDESVPLAPLPPHHRRQGDARKNITGDELIARTKLNGYQRGAHRDEDGLRDRNRRVDKAKRDQDAASDSYVL